MKMTSFVLVCLLLDELSGFPVKSVNWTNYSEGVTGFGDSLTVNLKAPLTIISHPLETMEEFKKLSNKTLAAEFKIPNGSSYERGQKMMSIPLVTPVFRKVLNDTLGKDKKNNAQQIIDGGNDAFFGAINSTFQFAGHPKTTVKNFLTLISHPVRSFHSLMSALLNSTAHNGVGYTISYIAVTAYCILTPFLMDNSAKAVAAEGIVLDNAVQTLEPLIDGPAISNTINAMGLSKDISSYSPNLTSITDNILDIDIFTQIITGKNR